MRGSVPVMLLALATVVVLTGSASACEIYSDTYGSPALGQGDALSFCLSGDPPLDSCVAIGAPPEASVVSVTIEDASGLPTYGTIGQDLNDDGLTDSSTNFCQSVTQFPVGEPDLGVREVIVFPHAAPGLGNDLVTPCLGVGTTGKVIFTWC